MEVSFTDPDQYGQYHPLENEELIGEKLKAFDAACGEIPAVEKENLTLAETNCPDLLTKEFKLQFLRCEVFNEELAAKRFAKYWDKRVEIFGPTKAFEPLTQEGALSEDKPTFSFGVTRLIPGVKDPSGRSILFFDPSLQDKTKYTNESMLRVIWYTYHAALENVEAQKHGIVLVVWPAEAKFAQFNRPLVKQMASSIKGCLPVRVSAFHICHPPTFFKVIFPIMKLFLGERLRKRVRVHAGSEESVLKHLENFGLTKDKLPAQLGGGVTLDHMKWLEERLAEGK